MDAGGGGPGSRAPWPGSARPAAAVLTGGIAYSALFSVFAALALGWTIFVAVLGDDAALRQDVLATVDATLPGLVDTGDDRAA